MEIVGPSDSNDGIALDGERAYWTATSPGRVRSNGIGERRWRAVVERPMMSPSAIVADATHVYWIDQGRGGRSRYDVQPVVPGAVLAAPKGGGVPVEIAREVQNPAMIAVDDTSVYWTDYDDQRRRRIRRAPKAGGAPTRLAEAQDISSLAVDGKFVYWADHTTLFRVPKVGGQPVELFRVSKTRAALTSILVDRAFIFVADRDGNLHRAPKAGGAAVRLAWFSGLAALAKDDDVLWVCGSDGLYRFPDPDGPFVPNTTVLDETAPLLAFLPDGQRLLGAGSASVRVFDRGSGRAETRYLEDRLARNPDTVLAISADRQSVFSSGPKSAVERWHIETGKLVWRSEVDTTEEWSLRKDLNGPLISLSDDGDRLIVGYSASAKPTQKDLLVVLDTTTGARVGQFQTDGVSSVALLPSSRLVVTNSIAEGPPLRIWDPQSGEQVGRFDGPPESVDIVVVSRDGTRIVTSSRERGLGVWDVEGRKLLRRFKTTDIPRAIALLGVGDRAVVSSIAKVCVWHMVEGKELSCAMGGGGPSLAVAPSGEEVAWSVGSVGNSFIRVWKIPR